MTRDFHFDALVELCRKTHEEMQSQAVRSVDLTLVMRNWLFGWYIVEFEQHGDERAKYGSHLLDVLSQRLAEYRVKRSSKRG